MLHYTQNNRIPRTLCEAERTKSNRQVDISRRLQQPQKRPGWDRSSECAIYILDVRQILCLDSRTTEQTPTKEKNRRTRDLERTRIRKHGNAEEQTDEATSTDSTTTKDTIRVGRRSKRRPNMRHINSKQADDTLNSIRYFIKTITNTGRNYNMIEGAYLDTIWAAAPFRRYRDGSNRRLETDHYPLKWPFGSLVTSAKLTLRRLRVQRF